MEVKIPELTEAEYLNKVTRPSKADTFTGSIRWECENGPYWYVNGKGATEDKARKHWAIINSSLGKLIWK